MPGLRLLVLTLLLAIVPSTGGAAEIEVVDPEGKPVSGARVEVWKVPETEGVFERVDARVAGAATGKEGRVSLALPRAGELLLAVDAPNHAPLLLSLPGAPPARLRLTRGGRLAGRVRTMEEPEIPEPIEGMACARWSVNLPRIGRTRTWERCGDLADSGEFALRGLPDGKVELTVIAPGFLQARRDASAGGEPVVVVLDPGVRLAGTVVGRRGRPVARARVMAQGELQVLTGDEGAFVLAVPALPAELQVVADGYLVGRETVTDPAAAGDLVIHLAQGQVLTGELLGDDGPIGRADFRIERQTGDDQWKGSNRTLHLSEGAFRLTLPEAGLYRLRIQVEGYRETAVPEVEVAPGEEVDLGVLVPSRGAGVRGLLIDGVTGDFVAGGVVELVAGGTQILDQALRGSSGRAVSGEDGSFVLTGLEAGSYDLRAEVDGRAPTLLDLVLAQDEVRDVGELVLGRGARILGRVIDRTGAPRPGLAVAVYPGDGDSLQPLAERWTDGEGRFEGPLLSPGTYHVRVRGERQLLSQRVEVPEGVERHELELVAGGVSLHGVVTRDGTPVEGGMLVFADQLDPGLRRGMIVLNTGGSLQASQSRFNLPESETLAEVAADGTFRVEDAPVGALVARFYGFEGAATTRRVEVPDEPEPWVVIDVGGAELLGTVVDDATEVGIEASVRLLTAAGGLTASTTSTPDGRFRVSDLEPGSYRLEVTAPGYRPALAADVRVAPGREPVVVRLEAGSTGGLAVRLQRADGSPLSRAQVTVLDASGVMVRSLLSEWNGERTFRDLPDGEYVVVWSDGPAGTGASPPIRVEAGETATYHATLPAAAPLSLRCEPSLCAGQGLELLQVLVPAGHEITPYLAGTQVGLRFSDGGRLSLGRLTPGRYLVRAGAGSLRAERLLEVRGGEVVVSLE